MNYLEIRPNYYNFAHNYSTQNVFPLAITKESIETAYCFLHQKERVFRYSNMDWQKEDIEYAIAQYVDSMPQDLYLLLAADRKDYLLDHTRFFEDMNDALEQLERLL